MESYLLHKAAHDGMFADMVFGFLWQDRRRNGCLLVNAIEFSLGRGSLAVWQLRLELTGESNEQDDGASD